MMASSSPAGEVPLGYVSVLPVLAQCRATGKIEIDGDWCVIPIGSDRGRQLLMVTRPIRDTAHLDVPIREKAEALAGTFLAMTNRAGFVTKLQSESRTDPLTGVANRRALLEHMEDEMGRATRIHRPLSLAMIDLDEFKRYNDTNGHVAGDTALRTLAASMAASVRASDLVARYVTPTGSVRRSSWRSCARMRTAAPRSRSG